MVSALRRRPCNTIYLDYLVLFDNFYNRKATICICSEASGMITYPMDQLGYEGLISEAGVRLRISGDFSGFQKYYLVLTIDSFTNHTIFSVFINAIS